MSYYVFNILRGAFLLKQISEPNGHKIIQDLQERRNGIGGIDHATVPNLMTCSSTDRARTYKTEMQVRLLPVSFHHSPEVSHIYPQYKRQSMEVVKVTPTDKFPVEKQKAIRVSKKVNTALK